ncbi:MAG: hypothetical protein ACQR33_01780 [Candidatus Saccharibacteria bacterium]
MSAIDSEKTLWLPEYFTVPSPEDAETLELMQTYSACINSSREFSHDSFEYKILYQQSLEARRAADERRAVPHAPISPDRARAIAAPLLKLLAAYGEETSPNSSFYRAQIHNRTETGLYVTTELCAQKHPIRITHPDEPDRFIEDFYTFDEAVAKRAQFAATLTTPESVPASRVVGFKMYPAIDDYPKPSDIISQRPDAPFEGGVDTDKPFFWATYPAEIPHPLLVELTDERLDDLQRFVDQFAGMIVQEADLLSAGTGSTA